MNVDDNEDCTPPRQFSPFQPVLEETIALFQEKGRMTIAMADGMKPCTIGKGKYITIRCERILKAIHHSLTTLIFPSPSRPCSILVPCHIHSAYQTILCSGSIYTAPIIAWP